jgi:hypothetical protein
MKQTISGNEAEKIPFFESVARSDGVVLGARPESVDMMS